MLPEGEVTATYLLTLSSSLTRRAESAHQANILPVNISPTSSLRQVSLLGEEKGRGERSTNSDLSTFLKDTKRNDSTLDT